MKSCCKSAEVHAGARRRSPLLWILGIEPEHIERHLTVDRDRLDPLNDGLSRALEHAIAYLLTSYTWRASCSRM